MRMAVHIALSLLILLPTATALAQKIPEEMISSEAPIEITADEITYYRNQRLYVATGEVIVKQGDELTLFAAKVGYNANTKVAEAEGDVLLLTKRAQMKAHKLKVQLESRCGLVINGKLRLVGDDYNLYISGDRIEKLGENRYRVESGTYHTCECGKKKPSWHVYAENADLTLNSIGLLRRAVFFAGPVPLMYFPYLAVPVVVERKSGFLAPTIGYSTRHGNYAGIPYFWAISPSSDLTATTTYYEKRGLELSGDYRFWAATNWRGRLETDFIEDRKYKDKRWRISYHEDHRFLPTAGIFGNVEILSDHDYPKHFPQRTRYRYFQFLESHMTLYGYTNFIDSFTDLGLYQNLTMADNSQTPQRAPEIGARIMGVNLFNIVILRGYFEALNIDREHRSELDQLVDPDGDFIPVHSQRLRFIPEALLHVRPFRLLDLRAFARREDDIYRTAELEEDDSHRGFFEYGSRLTLPFSRPFALRPIEVEESMIRRSIAHLVEPGIAYTRRPEIEDQNEQPFIDAYDRLPEIDRIDLFVNQYLIFRRWPTISLPTLLRNIELRVTQPVDFYAQREGEPEDLWAPLESELILLFAGSSGTRILVSAKTDYDHELGNFTLIGVLGALDLFNTFSLKADYRHRLNSEGDEIIDSLKGDVGLNLFNRIGISAGAIWEMIEDVMVENHQSVEYRSGQQCWKIVLTRREMAEPHEINYQMLLDLTGLLQVQMAR